jgi:thiamine biosynthesis lipoprotein
MKVGRSAVLAAALLTAALPLRAASAAPERFEYAEPHMGTLVRLVLYAPDRAAAQAAAKAAFDRVRALDAALSDYRDSSELRQVSRQAGGPPVPVSDDLFRVLSAAQETARASGGAFDPTAGPLSVLWREARRRQALPDPARLAAARALVGSEKLELLQERRTVRLRDAGMQLDLGGIAKGFAADEAAAVLRRCGIASALIAAGGDIVAMAAPPGTAGWRVAVAAIEGANHGPAGFLTLSHAAVSTSGDAEQFMIVDGVRYSHVFDPRSGRPLTGRGSVTVVAPDGTTSDALATAVSVMGGEQGLALVDGTPGAAALAVVARGVSACSACSAADSSGDGVRTFESRRWRALGGFAPGAGR